MNKLRTNDVYSGGNARYYVRSPQIVSLPGGLDGDKNKCHAEFDFLVLPNLPSNQRINQNIAGVTSDSKVIACSSLNNCKLELNSVDGIEFVKLTNPKWINPHSN